MADHRRRLALWAASGSLLVAGCAGVPDSGGVVEEAARAVPGPADGVEVIAGPAPQGATPEQVVREFLRAAAAFRDDHFAARSYLTSAAALGWTPAAGVVVYDDETGLRVEAAARRGTTVSVRLVARRVGSVSADGTFTAAEPGAQLVRTFPLVQADGEWRISRVDDGLLLTSSDIERSFTSAAPYFLSPGGEVVVPDLRLVRQTRREALPTVLVRAVLSGPSRRLAPAVTTAVPPGTELLGSAPVRDGTVTVDLSREVLDAGPQQLARLSAQLVWTLRQLWEVRELRLLADGSPLRVPGTPEVQPVPSWSQFDPDGSAGEAVYVRAGRLLRLDGEPVAGPWGSGRVALTAPAVAPARDLLAGLARSGDASVLYVGPPTRLVATARAERFTRPSFDRLGRVWTVATAAGVQSVAVVADRRRVPVTGLPTAGRVTELRVSRDGSRVAVVDAGALLVGVVVADSRGRLRVADLRRVTPLLAEVRSVSWADAGDLVLLARGPGAGLLSPWSVSSDGYRVDALATTGLTRYDSIAAGPGEPLRLLAAADGGVWVAEEGPWRRVAVGGQPTFPG